MVVIVDLQGFKRPSNVFVLKELAIVKEGVILPISYIFKPPKTCHWDDLPSKYKRQNTWLTQFHHGIDWKSGSEDYENILSILTTHLKKADDIYVKGDDKKKWLEELLHPFADQYNITNIEDLECPCLYELKREYQCAHHTSKASYSCAVDNVKMLADWMSTTSFGEGSIEQSIQLYSEVKHLAMLKDSDIAKLPRAFIVNYCTRDIDIAFHKLPKYLQDDKEIQSYRRCRKHNVLNGNHDEFDGPPPLIKNCQKCQDEMISVH